MADLKNFGNNLKKAREDKNITQKELAEQIDMTPASISAYEKGAKNPSLDVALKLAEYFNVSLDELLGLRPNKIETVEQFLRYFVLLCKSKALKPHYTSSPYGESFDGYVLHKCFETFQNGFLDIMNLYTQGTINENLLNLWVADEMKKWEKVNLSDYMTKFDALSFGAPPPITTNSSSNQENEDKEDDLPF